MEENDIFQNMSAQEIHEINRCVNNVSQLESKITEYFLNNQLFSEQESYNHLYIEANQYSNKYAISELAEWYQTGRYVIESEYMYIQELEHLFDVVLRGGPLGDASRIAKDLYDASYSCYLVAEMSLDDWICNSMLGSTGETLGAYYSGFSDVDMLNKAIYYLKIALWCHFDTEKLLESTRVRLNMLCKKSNGGITKGDTLENLKDTICCNPELAVSENRRAAGYRTVIYVQSQFDSYNWNKLQKETQSYLISATYSFAALLEIEKFDGNATDYGGVISSLMRALELELRVRFHKKYLDYLKLMYPDPEEFAKKIGIFKSDYNYEKKRFCLLKRKGDSVLYADSNGSDGSFKLGGFKSVIGRQDKKDKKIDFDYTMKEYCKNILFIHQLNDDQVKNTLEIIYRDVVSIIALRNNSSHGGIILTLEDAESAFEKLMLTYKMLNNLADLCRF